MDREAWHVALHIREKLPLRLKPPVTAARNFVEIFVFPIRL